MDGTLPDTVADRLRIVNNLQNLGVRGNAYAVRISVRSNHTGPVPLSPCHFSLTVGSTRNGRICFDKGGNNIGVASTRGDLVIGGAPVALRLRTTGIPSLRSNCAIIFGCVPVHRGSRCSVA